MSMKQANEYEWVGREEAERARKKKLILLINQNKHVFDIAHMWKIFFKIRKKWERKLLIEAVASKCREFYFDAEGNVICCFVDCKKSKVRKRINEKLSRN